MAALMRKVNPAWTRSLPNLELAVIKTECFRKNHTLTNSLIFKQLFDYQSYTYTYLLGCSATREAVLIDPVVEQVERDLKLADELDLKLCMGVNTHVHADHVTATGKLKEILGSRNFKSVLSEASGGKADLKIKEGDVIQFGEQKLDTLATPGHTNGCMTYVNHQNKLLMTGDTLLIRGCGRTDFQQGCANTLYDSVHEKIFKLPDDYTIYPGHDYRGFTKTSVGEEKTLNPRLSLPHDQFFVLMQNLKLAYPKLMDIAVPANLACGEMTKKVIEEEDNK